MTGPGGSLHRLAAFDCHGRFDDQVSWPHGSSTGRRVGRSAAFKIFSNSPGPMKFAPNSAARRRSF
jgi:hypothetical protein